MSIVDTLIALIGGAFVVGQVVVGVLIFGGMTLGAVVWVVQHVWGVWFGPKEFMLKHDTFGTFQFFTEDTAPTWLTSENTVPGSTMDNRWFWKEHVLTLKMNRSVRTGQHTITRVRKS